MHPWNVQAHWGLQIRTLHLQTAWSMEGPPAPQYSKQHLVNTEQTNHYGYRELSQYLWTTLEKIDTITEISSK